MAKLGDQEIQFEFKNILVQALRIRSVEEILLEAYKMGFVRGTLHTCIGQEYLPAVLQDYLTSSDWIFSNHRGHGHFLAAGGSQNQLIAEILGKGEGASKGIGGSQHLHFGRFFSNGIQGGLVPAAVGVGLVASKLDTDEISICFIGDGTLGQGQFWESINIASTLGSRILIICEDNEIAQSTPSKNVFGGDISMIIQGHGMKYLESDSRNLAQLSETVREAFDNVRTNKKPTFLHVKSYRLGAHSKGDDNRSDQKIKTLKETDPLIIALQRPDMQHLADSLLETLRNELSSISQMETSVMVPRDYALEILRTLPEVLLSEEEYFANVITENGKTQKLADSLYLAFKELFTADPKLLMIGEDIEFMSEGTDKGYGGAFKITRDLSQLYPGRLKNMPISEASIVGAALGFGLTGTPIIVEIMFGDFLFQTVDQIMQQISKIVSMYGIKINLPLIIRTPMGGGYGYGATHSQSIEKLFLGVPNLLVIAPNIYISPSYLLKKGMSLGLPILLIENKIDYRREMRNPRIQFDSVRIFPGHFPEIEIKNHRQDSDVMVITYGGSVENVSEVCCELEATQGLKFTIFTFVLLSPLNIQSLITSLGNTKRIVIVEEGTGAQGFGSELIARLTESGYNDLIFRRVSTLGIIPANELGEWAQLPNSDRIRQTIISVL